LTANRIEDWQYLASSLAAVSINTVAAPVAAMGRMLGADQDAVTITGGEVFDMTKSAGEWVGGKVYDVGDRWGLW